MFRYIEIALKYLSLPSSILLILLFLRVFYEQSSENPLLDEIYHYYCKNLNKYLAQIDYSAQTMYNQILY